MVTLNVSAVEVTTAPVSTTVVSTEKIVLDKTLPVTSEAVTTTVTSLEDEEKSNITDIEDDELVIPSGNGILLEDVLDEDVNRQFITIQSKNGNTFYIVIDKDSRGRENVYFMNTVDEYDLMAFAENFPEEVKDNKTTSTKPVVTDKNGKTVETVTETDENGDIVSKPVDNSGRNNNTLLIIVGVLAVAGVGAFCYFKLVKGKNSAPKKPDIDIDEDDEEYDDEPTVRDEEEDTDE